MVKQKQVGRIAGKGKGVTAGSDGVRPAASSSTLRATKRKTSVDVTASSSASTSAGGKSRVKSGVGSASVNAKPIRVLSERAQLRMLRVSHD